jgi:hypothetical protein
MAASPPIQLTLLPGARRLLALHARELPQRDDLCGAFCGALALGAAGIGESTGTILDQDAVAVAAGSVISPARVGTLPDGETGRRDYRLAIGEIEDSDLSGTTAAGVRDAVGELSAGALTAIPYAGPWNAATLAGLFELVAALPRPASLIANFATHHLWGASASVDQLLGYLLDGEQAGPAPDWHVGHFACVFARAHGPGGALYAIADTYPSLGNRGVHLQPQERLAAALERADMPAGGMLAVVCAEDVEVVRTGVGEIGLHEQIWDNGTTLPEPRS